MTTSYQLTSCYEHSSCPIFDGNFEKYELWEVKFLAHLCIRGLDDVLEQQSDGRVDGATPLATKSTENGKNYIEMNRLIFNELVLRLDDISLSIIMRETKDDGIKALAILRDHYIGMRRPSIMSQYNNMINLKKEDDESVISYIIRIEKAATSLKNAGESVSDLFLIALALDGLPKSYSTFTTVFMQEDPEFSIAKFKKALEMCEAIEKVRRKEVKIHAAKERNKKKKQV